MNKKSDKTESAEKVSDLFKKESQPERAQSKQSKERAYHHNRQPTIRPEINQLKPKNVGDDKVRKIGQAKVVPQKTPKSALEQMHCNANQNYPLFFIEKAEALKEKSVQRFSLKEQLIAKRNIKRVSHEMQHWIYSRVQNHSIKPLEKGDERAIYDLLEKREERHFQLDRIIRYLSEP